jgi:putative ABC transport system permease protein
VVATVSVFPTVGLGPREKPTVNPSLDGLNRGHPPPSHPLPPSLAPREREEGEGSWGEGFHAKASLRSDDWEQVMRWYQRLFRRARTEKRLDAELRFHLEHQIADYVAAGMTPEEARRRARLDFGGLGQVKDECRDVGAARIIDTLIQDVRFGLRQLRRNPGFTALAVLTLALGIGANTAVFSLLDSVLLRPLPYSHADRLFRLFPTDAKHWAMESTSYPDFQDWKQRSRTFDEMAAYYQQDVNLTGTPEPERLRALFCTPELLPLLGTHLRMGRNFSANEGQRVAVVGYGLWRRRFAADPAVIGKPVYLDGRAYTVLGVLPPHFYFPPHEYEGELTPQIFLPAVPNLGRAWNYVRVIGRLASGVTRQQAQAEMNGIAARLAQANPNADHGPEIWLGWIPEVAASSMSQTTWILFGAVGFVLLIACANVANLLLVRAVAREHEIAVRIIVGATQSRVMRQLLTESALIAVFGGALGVAVAGWTLPLLAHSVPQNTMFFTRVHDVGVHLSLAVFVFSTLLGVLSAVVFGLLPAWRATRPVRTRRPIRYAGGLRGALIALEVALSFVLLTGAGLMMRSLIRLRDVNVGFRTRGLLTMDVSLSGEKYSSPEEQAAFFGQALTRLQSLPSVRSAAAVTNLPLTRNGTRNSFEIPAAHAVRGSADYNAVSPDYFRTMGIPLLSGREFVDSDSARTPLVGVISGRMAQRYWPHQDPVGASIVVSRPVGTRTPKGTLVHLNPQQLTIVGVVGDVRQLGLDAPPEAELYVPYPQWPSSATSLVIRTYSEPSLLIPLVEKLVWSVDPDQPVTDVRTMGQWVSKEAASRRFVLQLIGVFALIAIVLAAVGIYGVVSNWTRQRTHEIGIRMALGAQKSDVVRLVTRQGMTLSLMGLVVGVGVALGVTRFLSNLLYGVNPTDPLTFAVVSLTLLAVALLACCLPARRAANVDPMVALRHE